MDDSGLAGPDGPAQNSKQDRPLRVFLACTGVGTGNRGIESFFRECFNGLYGTEGLDITLLKGAGPDGPGEERVWCLAKDKPAAKWIGKLLFRPPYSMEQISSVFPIARRIRRSRPDIVFSSDGRLCERLVKYRKWIGVPFRLVFSNGGPTAPPFPSWDHVHQTTPFEYQLAIEAGESAERHSMAPYGISVPAGDPLSDRSARLAKRRELGLPEDRPIILSVGWIQAYLKRMDYLVQDLARLPSPRPFLVMLGSMDEGTPPILKLARELLGEGNFAARSVPYEQITTYYQASDVFALCSLREGFGRVFMEAPMHGLPCVVQDHPVMRYVLGDQGTFVDMARPGSLAEAVRQRLQEPSTPDKMAERRNSVRRRFSWEVLAPAYRSMFQAAMRNPLRSAAHSTPQTK
jgi:1,2-diacylglycerol 3-alpha-glucosyltransferase